MEIPAKLKLMVCRNQFYYKYAAKGNISHRKCPTYTDSLAWTNSKRPEGGAISGAALLTIQPALFWPYNQEANRSNGRICFYTVVNVRIWTDKPEQSV